jgi:hypothetical protein
MTDTDERHETLRSGELKILGRIRSASNATFLCEAQRGDDTVHCVYKPVAGEQLGQLLPAQSLRERVAELARLHRLRLRLRVHLF